MVYDKTKMSKNNKEIINKVKEAISRPSVSALIYGYLKEKDVNLLNMTVDQWKAIEKDLVEIILSEVYPGEEIPEDQLTFSALTQSFAFMSNFIETLERNSSSSEDLSKILSSDYDEDGKPKFEI